jgi:hypothetical protein
LFRALSVALIASGVDRAPDSLQNNSSRVLLQQRAHADALE